MLDLNELIRILKNNLIVLIVLIVLIYIFFRASLKIWPV